MHERAVQHSTYSAITRPLCDLTSHVPPSLLGPNKKLKCYCLGVHPLQPHLVATGTSVGVILNEFDPKAVPAAVALPAAHGSKEHIAAFVVEKELRLLSFQLSTPFNATVGSTNMIADTARPRQESHETFIHVKQTKKHVASIPHDAHSLLSVSKSGKHVAIVYPEVPYFCIYRVSDWAIVDSGSVKYFAWDSCKERYALLETAAPLRMPQLTKGRKAKEAAVAAAAAAAAAASAAASATVQIRIILDDGSANQLAQKIEGRAEPVMGLQGGSLLGVAYKFPPRMSFSTAAAASAASGVQSASFSGLAPTFSSMDDSSGKGENPSNFQLYSWETYKPVGGLMPQPEWTSWDQTVEYCAFGYTQYVVISSLRPQYRYLGNVAIVGSTGGVWHRRQLFLATPTTIECVFVDAGVSLSDLNMKREKEEMKVKNSQAQAIAEHGELALITVETSKPAVEEKVSLRPPMLQVVRLASFQHAPTIPPIMAVQKHMKAEVEESGVPKNVEDRRSAAEVAVAGGGVAVAISRLPPEQKRPVGPLIVVGVRDGVLWVIDRYMTAHAIGLAHPGIRCRCLAAHGDAISAVKWAARLGREHHDDLAQFLLGMGYATEALHLPGISKTLEFELAVQSNDLKRALQCLLTLSNSKNIGKELDASNDSTGILNLPSAEITSGESVQGVIKYAKEFLQLIDAADATGQTQIASHALRRLAAAGSIKGALQSSEFRSLALRLASHGELTRLGVLVTTMITAGQGREAALGAALLGDSALLEKSLEETGMLAEAALHAQAHGRPALKKILQSWNHSLERELKMLGTKSPSAFSQVGSQLSTDDIVLKELNETKRKPLVEIVPPGNVILDSSTLLKPIKPSTTKPVQPQAGQPLMLEGPPAATAQHENAHQQMLTKGGLDPVSVSTAVSALPADPVLAALTLPTNSDSQVSSVNLLSTAMASASDVSSLMGLEATPAVSAAPIMGSSSMSLQMTYSIPVVGSMNVSSLSMNHQVVPTSVTPMPVGVNPALDPQNQPHAMFPTVVSSALNPSTPLGLPQLPMVNSQPLKDIQPLFAAGAVPVGVPMHNPSPVGNIESMIGIADGKTSESTSESTAASRPGPSVAALVDFFS
ncbi:hypothetical protein KP509_33G065100 [Ceratopteris richardii]|uniref:Transducin/WD40 repeat-like superfamily protein n=1 Tax=Ceratopteris richardii TaxID=49495 RepID=A0A8T2QPZ4_CERRI|nr:hypothetical protein KP509_33G065100 [Ceratopteris richardii]